MMRRSIVASVLCSLSWVGVAWGQQPDSAARAHCDSTVATARVDSAIVALYIKVTWLDGDLPASQAKILQAAIGTTFIPPKPLRLSVFSGPSSMRALRRVTSDTSATLRTPDLTGVYRFTLRENGLLSAVDVVRQSLVAGFDSAARSAVISAMQLADAKRLPEDEDSMRVEVRLSLDSLPGGMRVVSAFFPRMPVVDAVPRGDNPRIPFPSDEDSTASAEVVLRFVVGGDGSPIPQTVQVARASGLSFLRAAILGLTTQRFVPATIHGCPVAQVVEFAISFVPPGPPSFAKGPERD